MKAPSVGIMQGRLSPPVGTAIQAFPAQHWADEFPAAEQAGIACIEWIYDIDGDDVNPLCADDGLARLRELQARHGVKVESICADYFMPQPLLKGSPEEQRIRRDKLLWLLRRAILLGGIQRVILPFVDASKIHDEREAAMLIELLADVIAKGGDGLPEIHLETSLPPARFAELLGAIHEPLVKVNYDSGNSSSLGYDADAEFAAYGSRIGSIHIKDRVFGGSTVPLGEGDADFPKLLRNIRTIGYERPVILQVARGRTGEETAWAAHNREIVQGWFKNLPE